MKKFLIAGLCLCALLGPAACSAPPDEDEDEKGRIEEFTDEVARDATDAIRRPVDKARNVRDLAGKHVDELEQQ